MDSASVYVIIPTYNEVLNVEELLMRLRAENIENLKVLFIDDNSPDGTAQTIEKHIRNTSNNNLSLVTRSHKQGLGTAYKETFLKLIESDIDSLSIIIQMDADLSHNPSYLKSMIELISKYDVVVGSRYIPFVIYDNNWSIHRKILSFVGNKIIRLILNIDVMDITSGFKAFKLSALKKLPWDNINAKGFAFQSEMAYQCQKSQLNIIEIPIEFNSRYNGYSKMSKLIILETIYRVLRIRIKSSFVK